ncbi:DUF3472 domain-containing protein [Bartonella sp. AD13SXNS]|uniref:DUF3472 domain-containing protein n=1 Tax=Bartonella sp. AD13SXNS TaxID=3243462 RepID=UPI0035CFFD35
MYHTVKKVILILLFLLISKPSYAIFAGKVIAIEHEWLKNASFDLFIFTQQVNYDGGPNSIYFWGNKFEFQNGKSGQIGFFNRSGRTIHFSIWNATGWKGNTCKHFTQEGSGVRCEIKFPWEMGRRYQLYVEKNGNLVTATVVDFITGKQVDIGTIEVPNTFGQFRKSSSFVEDHSRWKRHLSSCYDLSPQSSIFFEPQGIKQNKIHETILKASNQGKCQDSDFIQTSCTSNFCMTSISDFGGLASPTTKPEIPISNGKDLSAETISNVLKQKELVVIRSKNRSWAPNIFLPSPDSFKWKSIFIDHLAAYSSTLHTTHGTQKITKGQKIMYMSDGKTWKITKKN